MLSDFFNWRTVLSDNQTVKEVISDKRDLERACLFAEKALGIVNGNAVFEKAKVKKRYEHFVRKFRRYR